MNTEDKLSIRAMLYIASQCIQKYSKKIGFTSTELNEFCKHLEEGATAKNITEWDDASMQLSITGYGDPIPEDLLRNYGEEIDLITQNAREISGSQMYTQWNYKESHCFLSKVASQCGVELNNLDVYYEHPPGEHGWGEVVSPELLKKWKR